MVRIEHTVRMQQLHYLLSGSYMRSKAHNFDSTVTKMFICLANGPRMGEFQYGLYKIYNLKNIGSTNFHGST